MAPWPWQTENTVVDSARHSRGQPRPALHRSFPASTSSSRPSPWDCCALWSIGSWLYRFFFFLAYALSFVFSLLKPPLSLKRELSLLSVGLSSMARSRKGYPLQCVFTFWIQSVDHVGPFLVKHSSLLPQKLGAKVLAEEPFSGLEAFLEKWMSCVTSGVFHPFHRLKDRKICVRDNVHCSKQGWGRESVSYS